MASDGPGQELISSPAPPVLQVALFTPTPKAARRVLEFFTAQINNDHARKAYLNATRRFADWCEARGVGQLAQVQPGHVAAFVKELQQEFTPPTLQQGRQEMLRPSKARNAPSFQRARIQIT
jgi:site-specific recombinase XerD